MAKILGVGGVFFKSPDPKRLAQWYATHLGLVLDDYGGARLLPENLPAGACTVWNPFAADTEYFAPSTKPYMLNFIVDDVAAALEQVRSGGAQVVGDIADYSYGRFGHFIDPDGNKIELWETKPDA